MAIAQAAAGDWETRGAMPGPGAFIGPGALALGGPGALGGPDASPGPGALRLRGGSRAGNRSAASQSTWAAAAADKHEGRELVENLSAPDKELYTALRDWVLTNLWNPPAPGVGLYVRGERAAQISEVDADSNLLASLDKECLEYYTEKKKHGEAFQASAPVMWPKVPATKTDPAVTDRKSILLKELATWVSETLGTSGEGPGSQTLLANHLHMKMQLLVARLTTRVTENFKGLIASDRNAYLTALMRKLDRPLLNELFKLVWGKVVAFDWALYLAYAAEEEYLTGEEAFTRTDAAASAATRTTYV